MVQDLAYSFRHLRRYPLLAIAAVLTLGLGIGGATAVFSVVDAVLLRPLPFPEPDRLVRVSEVTPDGARFSFSDANYLDLQAESRAFAHVAAYRDGGSVVLTGTGEPSRILAVPISATATGVLDMRAAIGRLFTSEEDRPGGGERAIVLSDALWRRRFDADASAIGRTVRLDNEPFIVIGVMPAGFDFPRGADAWVPLRANRASDRDDKALSVIARAGTGVTLEQMRQELREFGQRLSAAHPVSNAGWSADAISFTEWLVAPRFRDAVWVLFGAVGLLLLLACANVANLLLAHGAARAGEMRVRAALGANRARLARQLFTESAVLGVLGTTAGMLIAFWSVEAVRILGDDRVPRLDEVRVDASVLAFACLAGLASCVIFGFAPALHAARTDLRSGMDQGVRHTAASRRVRQTLVVVEVALALLLLVGAGLLGQSFIRLMRADPGFDTNGLLAMSVEVSPARYPDDRLTMFYGDLLDRVSALPGVAAAGASSTNPFRQFGFSNNVTPEDRAAQAPPSGLVQAGWRSVTPGFFATMRIPVLRGRTFTAADRDGAERVVVISEALAKQLWPDGDAVGKRIFWGGTTGRTRAIVGVTGDVQDVHLGAAATPMLFVPHAQVDMPGMTVLVRTDLGRDQIDGALRSIVRQLDAGLPAPEVHAVDTSRADAAGGERFNLALLGAFAAIAGALAVTGVYSMLAFTIVERRRELAVRLALGAASRDIVGLLLGGGLSLAALGVTIGIAGAFALTRVMSSLLYEVAPTDLRTFLAAALLLLSAVTAACYLPARRAGRVDPQSILRE